MLGTGITPGLVFAQFADVYWTYEPRPVRAAAGSETEFTLIFRNGGPDSFQPTASLGSVNFQDIEVDPNLDLSEAPGIDCQLDPFNFVSCRSTTDPPIVIPPSGQIEIGVTIMMPSDTTTIVAKANPSSVSEPFENNETEIVFEPGPAGPGEVDVLLGCGINAGKVHSDDCQAVADVDLATTVVVTGDDLEDFTLNLNATQISGTQQYDEVVPGDRLLWQLGQQGFGCTTEGRSAGCSGLSKGSEDFSIDIALNPPLSGSYLLTVDVVLSGEAIATQEVNLITVPNITPNTPDTLTAEQDSSFIWPFRLMNEASLDEPDEFQVLVTFDETELEFLQGLGEGVTLDDPNLATLHMPPDSWDGIEWAVLGEGPTNLDVTVTWNDGTIDHEILETLTTVEIGKPCLRVSKAADTMFPPILRNLPDSLTADTLSYYIVVENDCDGPATLLESPPEGIRLYEPFSPDCRTDSFIDPSGAITGENVSITCDVSRSVYAFGALPERSGEATNVVQVSAAGRTATDVFTTDAQELLVSVEPPPERTAEYGSYPDWTVIVENPSSHPAEDVRFVWTANVGSFPEPPGADCNGSDIFRGEHFENLGTRILDCSVGTLSPGQSTSRVIEGTVDFRRLGGPQSVAAFSADGRYTRETDLDHAAVGFQESEVDFLLEFLRAFGKRSHPRDGLTVLIDSTEVLSGVDEASSHFLADVPIKSLSPTVTLLRESQAIGTYVVPLFDSESRPRLSPASLLLFVPASEDSVALIPRTHFRLAGEEETKTDVIIFNAILDAPELTVKISGIAESENNLSFAESSDYVTLEPGPHFLEVRETKTGTGHGPIRFDVAEHTGQAVALVLSGNFESGSISLTAFDATGASVPVPVETEAVELPDRLALHGNYPNPFRESTAIRFDLPEPAKVQLDVFDLLGRLVDRLDQRSFEAGFGITLEFGAEDLPPGAYFYRLKAEAEFGIAVESGSMVIGR